MLRMKRYKSGYHAGHIHMTYSRRGVRFGTIVHQDASRAERRETYNALKRQVEFSLFLTSAD
jgi:hypothetical protein